MFGIESAVLQRMPYGSQRFLLLPFTGVLVASPHKLRRINFRFAAVVLFVVACHIKS